MSGPAKHTVPDTDTPWSVRADRQTLSAMAATGVTATVEYGIDSKTFNVMLGPAVREGEVVLAKAAWQRIVPAAAPVEEEMDATLELHTVAEAWREFADRGFSC